MVNIDLVKTGNNIAYLRKKRGITIAELQNYFGFTSPCAIYKWQRGDSLPTLDNMINLSELLGVSVEDIVVMESME